MLRRELEAFYHSSRRASGPVSNLLCLLPAEIFDLVR
jgi:hypothetical protein